MTKNLGDSFQIFIDKYFLKTNIFLESTFKQEEQKELVCKHKNKNSLKSWFLTRFSSIKVVSYPTAECLYLCPLNFFKKHPETFGPLCTEPRRATIFLAISSHFIKYYDLWMSHLALIFWGQQRWSGAQYIY